MKSPQIQQNKLILEMYEAFDSLPLSYKEKSLNGLGDQIRDIQFKHPKSASVLQMLYDLFYMMIEQEKADRAFAIEGMIAAAVESRGGAIH